MDPIQPIGEPDRTLRLLAFAVRRHLADMPQSRDGATATANVHRDRAIEHMAVTLRTTVLAEELPPQTIRAYGTGEHHFDIRATVGVPQWASWWQHCKATHRHRWWMAPIAKRRPPRVQWVTAWESTTHRRTCHHDTTVEVRTHWTYPHTPHVVPPDLGYAILKTSTVPWMTVRPGEG